LQAKKFFRQNLQHCGDGKKAGFSYALRNFGVMQWRVTGGWFS
jgi:hypothetical protein